MLWCGGSASRRNCQNALLPTLRMPAILLLVSAASAWELAIKANLGKIDAMPLVSELGVHIDEEGFEEFPIAIRHAAPSRPIRSALGCAGPGTGCADLER